MENFTNLKKILSIVFALMAPYVFGQSPVQPIKSTNSDGYRLIVKFSPDYVFDAEEGNLFLSPHKNIPVDDLNILKDYEFEQVLEFTNEEKSQMRAGIYLPPRGKNSFNIYKFRGLMYLKGAETKTFEELNAIAKKLELIDFVEYTDLIPLKSPPDPTSTNNGRSDTPDLTHHQDYRQYLVGGDVFGINIDFAWAIGIYGQGIEIADIESGFDYEHEDLERAKFTELVPHWDGVSFDHGTAVCGVMFSIENEYGMTGMVHGADKFYGISRYLNSDAQELVPGITTGIEELNIGDVFLFELQSFGPFPAEEEKYIPIDWHQSIWDLTQAATTAGIIVVAAGGNGGVNLDDEELLEAYLARGDNGAIIAGAGTRNGRNRADFSTYGSRIILQGWGDWTVATTGYGALYDGGEHATYTGSFAGTSSATPIVASAAVAVQSYAKNYLGTILTPLQMRALLFETGTPQGTGWGDNTVRLPNVGAAIQQLMEDHDIPANDFCNTATELSCGVSISGSTENAHNFVLSQLESCGGIVVTNNGVWFTYTAPTTQYTSITTDLPATNFDTKLRVFTSSGVTPCEGPFECVTGNDDINFPINANSRVSFIANAGVTYYIYLDGFASATGDYSIIVETCCNVPQAICKPTNVELDANGQGSITASDINDGSTTACGFQTISASKLNFNCDDQGINPVTLTVTDIYGNESTCIANVNVQDMIPPSITCPILVEVAAAPGTAYAAITDAILEKHEPAVASDNCGTPNITNNRLDQYPIGIHEITWTAKDASDNEDNCTQTLIIYPAYYLKLHLWLQSAYHEGTEEMSTALNVAGQLPGIQPYDFEPWEYEGEEVIASPYVVPDEMVDWVLVELRTDESTPLPYSRRAGRLLKSGVVVVDFDGLIEDGDDPYYVVVYHRNHMPVMSSVPITILSTGTSYDFTQLTNVYGQGAVMLKPGVYGMPSGNTIADNVLKYSGPENDRGPILAYLYANATPPVFINTILSDGYWLLDNDLNNEISYIGNPNDRAVIIANIFELLNTTLLTAVYESPIPGLASFKSGGKRYQDGPLDLKLAADQYGFGFLLSTNEPIRDGVLDNLQFTLAWHADDTEIAQMLFDYTSTYMLQAQGEPISVDDISYQTYAMAVPLLLPAQWNMDEDLRVLWFNTDHGLNTFNRMWIADNDFISQYNGMYYASVWGRDHTGIAHGTAVSVGDQKVESSIKVYPNPVSDRRLTIEYAGLSRQALQLILHDAAARQVLYNTLKLEGNGRTNIDLSNLQPGVYSLQLLGIDVNHKEKIVILR